MFLPFFCPANIYRPSLGKVQLSRSNPTLQRLNFYLVRKKKTLLRIVCPTNPWIPIFIDFHLFLKNILKILSNNKKKFPTLYIIIITFFFNIPPTSCCEVFADVNAIYFTALWWIMNACSGFETKNLTFGKMHFNIFTLKMN